MKHRELYIRSVRYVVAIIVIIVLIVTIVTVVERSVPIFHEGDEATTTVDHNSTNSTNSTNSKIHHKRAAASLDCFKKKKYVPPGAECCAPLTPVCNNDSGKCYCG